MHFHRFEHDVGNVALPEKFTYPFCYTPHLLCVEAANEVQAFIAGQPQWHEELKDGKMFGVLVVRNAGGEIGYLSAYSGNLDGRNNIPYFVPPVYDMLAPDGFLKREEREITKFNHLIAKMERDENYLCLRDLQKTEMALFQKEVAEAKSAMKRVKVQRDLLRLQSLSEKEKNALVRESQFQKAELRRLEKHWRERIAQRERQLLVWKNRINALKCERKKRSAVLQQQLFEQVHLMNAFGEKCDLFRVFHDFGGRTPPSGAGDCAAPKLLQYAYIYGFTPLCMAEFWWGNSPQSEIRRHGFFYPACRSKCEPILAYMLQGIDVEPNPLEYPDKGAFELEVLYEDDGILAVNKPAGILSVPGKSNLPSVYGWLRKRFPEVTGPMIVHRLDMATSGIMLVAKTKAVHQNLQAQFKNHTVRKRYVALLDGVIEKEKGEINLPIRPNPDERPQQMVDNQNGKPSITSYEVIGRENGRTRMAFYPRTGRTHQLRIHAAHPQGLNTPIIGDMIYGRPSDRLYLHSEQIAFWHPTKGCFMQLKIDPDF